MVSLSLSVCLSLSLSLSLSLQSSVTLCAYPFILNAQAKTTMLQTDAELQMQVPAMQVVLGQGRLPPPK